MALAGLAEAKSTFRLYVDVVQAFPSIVVTPVMVVAWSDAVFEPVWVMFPSMDTPLASTNSSAPSAPASASTVRSPSMA